MFRKIEITEENFEKILKKLQKTCRKHKMIEKKSSINTKTGEKGTIHWSCGISILPRVKGDYEHMKKKFVIHSNMIHPIKHPFRQKFEDGVDDFETRHFVKDRNFPTLIHISTGPDAAIVLDVGSYVKFLPFGAFTIYDHTLVNDGISESIYIHTFIPHFFSGKIKDYEKEIKDREKQEEELNDIYYDRELEEDNDYYMYCDMEEMYENREGVDLDE